MVPRTHLQQIGHLIQREPKPLRGFDDPQHGDGFLRVQPVPTRAANRLSKQPTPLVVAQRLPVHPGGFRDLSRA